MRTYGVDSQVKIVVPLKVSKWTLNDYRFAILVIKIMHKSFVRQFTRLIVIVVPLSKETFEDCWSDIFTSTTVSKLLNVSEMSRIFTRLCCLVCCLYTVRVCLCFAASLIESKDYLKYWRSEFKFIRNRTVTYILGPECPSSLPLFL